MLSLLAPIALVFAVHPAVPAAPAPTAEPPAATASAPELDADLDLGGLDATPDAVPVCILTYCRDVGERCDYTGVNPIRNCCEYTCYEDHECQTRQDPPNVCKKGRKL